MNERKVITILKEPNMIDVKRQSERLLRIRARRARLKAASKRRKAAVNKPELTIRHSI